MIVSLSVRYIASFLLVRLAPPSCIIAVIIEMVEINNNPLYNRSDIFA